MIFDCRAYRAHASFYSVVDAVTGSSLDHLRVFYADDEAGIIRVLLPHPETGGPYLAYASDGRTPVREEDRWEKRDAAGHSIGPETCVAWEEQRRDIRIVARNDGMETEIPASTPPSSWRDRPSLL